MLAPFVIAPWWLPSSSISTPFFRPGRACLRPFQLCMSSLFLVAARSGSCLTASSAHSAKAGVLCSSPFFKVRGFPPHGPAASCVWPGELGSFSAPGWVCSLLLRFSPFPLAALRYFCPAAARAPRSPSTSRCWRGPLGNIPRLPFDSWAPARVMLLLSGSLRALHCFAPHPHLNFLE